MNKFLLTVFLFVFGLWFSQAQYCVPTYATGCSSDLIEDFTILDAGFSHLDTGCSPDAYGDFTDDSNLEIDMQISVPYNFEVVYGTQFTQSVKIWIDLNEDEVFDDSELLFESSNPAAQHSGVLTIPSNLTPTTTRMRVMGRFGGWVDGNDACTPGSSWGETQDYTVNITPAPDCPMPAGISISNITGVTADLSFDEVSEAVNGYTYNVFLQDDDIETATPVISETLASDVTSTTITGLSGQTDYKVTLQSDCDTNGLSNITSPISFTTLETCIPPNGFEANSITEDSVIFSWDEVPNAEDGYEWFVFSDGDDPEVETPLQSGTVNFGTNQVTVNGLNSGETFQAYISSDCGSVDGQSLLSAAIQFATLCTTFPAPYFENFDGSSWVSGTGFSNINSEVDPCWSRDPNSPAFFWGTREDGTGSGSTGPSADASGSGKYVFTEGSNGVEGDEAFLVSPPIDLSALGTPAVTFKYHMYGQSMGSFSLEVKLVSVAAWDEIFFVEGEQQTSNDADWLEEIIEIDAYQDEVVQFRFKAVRGSDFYNDLGVDEFLVDEAPTCFNVSNLAVTSTVVDGASFSWDENPDATDGYVWDVFDEGDNPFTDTPIADGTSTTNSASVSGLDASTVYQFRVRSDCGASGLSSPGVLINFQTECDVVPAPYSENFDGSTWASGTGFGNTGSEIDQCWDRDPDALGFFWGTREGTTGSGSTGPSSDFSGSGNYIFTEGSNGNEGDVANLTSPLIDLTPLTDPSVSFYYHMYGQSMGDFIVEVKESSATEWDEIFIISGSQQTSSDDDWIQLFLDLNAYQGQVVQIRFKAVRGNNFYNDLGIDEFLVDETPSCFNVTGFTVSAGLDTATFNWNEIESATDGYTIEVYNEGDEIGVDTPIVSEDLAQDVTTYEATGLTENSDYVATIISNCGTDGFGELITLEFFTVALGDNCSAAIEISSVPYTTTDDTTNYTDFYDGSAGAECGSTSPYLNGNDVVYSFTPNQDMVVLVTMDPTNTWSGIFVYESCADIGTQCLNGEANSGSDIREFEVTLTGGEDYFFVISTWAAPQTTGYTLEISEVLCGAVSGLETTFIGGEEVDLSWDSVPSAVNYQWELFNAGADPDTDTPIESGSTTDTFLSFTDLTSSTAYDFYVLSECSGGETGNLSDPLSFVTDCLPQSFPTPVEDFSNATFNYNTNDLMPCWSEGTGELTASMSITDANSTWGAGNYANTPNTENGQSARLNVYGTGTNWLVSQQIDLGDGTTDLVIEYDASLVPFIGGSIDSPQVTTMGQHTIDVVVSTDGGNTWSDQDIIYTYDNSNIPSPDQTDYVSLDGYSGLVKIGFYVNRVASEDLWFSMDNFRVIESPTCFAPINLEAEIVGLEDVEFSWDTNELNAVEDEWEVQYGLEGFELDSDESESVIVNGTPSVTVDGLASASDYEFYVRSICGTDDVSEWRGPESFRSPIVPIEIGEGEFHNEVYCYGNFETTEWLFVSTADETLDLIFNAGSIEDTSGSNDVLLIYDGFNENGNLIYDSSSDGAVLAGVTLTSTSGGFYMKLTSDLVQSCQGGQGELPEEFDFDVLSETFSTPGFGKEDFSYYPNPVQSSLNIQSDKLVESIELFNISGQKLMVKTPKSNSPSIQMQDLPSGVYLMKVSIEGKFETFQIIKE